jgi:hypothetical protein
VRGRDMKSDLMRQSAVHRRANSIGKFANA